jgi:hypothetical protein
MYKTNAGRSKLDELFGDGTLFRVMDNEELKRAALVVKEMGKKKVGQWRPSELFKSTQEIFTVLNRIFNMDIKVQHRRAERTAIDGVVTVDFDVRLLTLLLLTKQGLIDGSPEESTVSTLLGSYFGGVVSLKEKQTFNILDADQAVGEVMGFVITPLFYKD